MGGGSIMFADKFTAYDNCAPAGVLLPKIKIEKKFTHYALKGAD